MFFFTFLGTSAAVCLVLRPILYDGTAPATAPATHRQRTRNRPGKDNLAPAEDVHNKNPSLVALGKNVGPRVGPR